MGRGLLVFKGDKNPPPKRKERHAIKKKKKKKEHSSSKGNSDDTVATSAVEKSPSIALVASSTAPLGTHRIEDGATRAQKGRHKYDDDNYHDSDADYQSGTASGGVRKGTGRITSSGSVVSGHGTCFSHEFAAGDAILVSPPQGSVVNDDHKKAGVSESREMRVVKMRLSDSSCGISSSFSSDLKSPAEFWYICRPRDIKAEKRKKTEDATRAKEEEVRMAFGTYGTGGDELVYRERTETGSYVIRREKLEAGVERTRSDLLDMRSKKKSDKYCF